jgi:hypothetical protein
MARELTKIIKIKWALNLEKDSDNNYFGEGMESLMHK